MTLTPELLTVAICFVAPVLTLAAVLIIAAFKPNFLQ